MTSESLISLVGKTFQVIQMPSFHCRDGIARIASR
jgi:hypothetical protein